MTNHVAAFQSCCNAGLLCLHACIFNQGQPRSALFTPFTYPLHTYKLHVQYTTSLTSYASIHLLQITVHLSEILYLLTVQAIRRGMWLPPGGSSRGGGGVA